MPSAVSSVSVSSYPFELQKSIGYIKERAPELIDRAENVVGSIQVTLTLSRDSIPTYRNWLTPWNTYVLKTDLKKLPIEIVGLDRLGDENYVYASELAERNIQINSMSKSAYWSPDRKTIYFPVELLKTCRKQDHLYVEVAVLCYELGNAAESAYYQSLQKTKQCDFIEKVELREKEVHERTGKLLKELNIPDSLNPYRFRFPEKAYLMAMEVIGHIEKTNRYYCSLNGVSLLPPRSLWERPIEDRRTLQSLIYQQGLVCFGSDKEAQAARREIKRLEASLCSNDLINWNQFKSFCFVQDTFQAPLS